MLRFFRPFLNLFFTRDIDLVEVGLAVCLLLHWVPLHHLHPPEVFYATLGALSLTSTIMWNDRPRLWLLWARGAINLLVMSCYLYIGWGFWDTGGVLGDFGSVFYTTGTLGAILCFARTLPTYYILPGLYHSEMNEISKAEKRTGEDNVKWRR